MSKDKRVLGKVGMALLLVFFYAPILFMIIFSFNSSKSLTHFTGFSLRWYEAMLKNHGMMESLYVTIVIALLATIISTIIGTITAIGLSKSKKVLRAFISQVNDFPIMNPEIVTAIGLMLLFITFQIEKGFVTLLLAHIAFCIPYVILSIMPKIKSLDPNLADAAMDLGATPWQALAKVIVPQIMPGIVSGALIAFTMSFDDFIISYFVTGNTYSYKIRTYTVSGGKTHKSSFSAAASAKVVPKRVKSVSAMALQGNSAVVRWKRDKWVTGYQVYKKSNIQLKYRRVRTTKKNTVVKFTDGKAVSGYTYYYKVRSYKVVYGKKVYGKYSKVVSLSK